MPRKGTRANKRVVRNSPLIKGRDTVTVSVAQHANTQTQKGSSLSDKFEIGAGFPFLCVLAAMHACARVRNSILILLFSRLFSLWMREKSSFSMNTHCLKSDHRKHTLKHTSTHFAVASSNQPTCDFFFLLSKFSLLID